MSEDRDLLDRIAKISGQINIQRAHLPSAQASSKTENTTITHWNKTNSNISPSAPWRSQRVAPYPPGRGRGGRVAPVPHRHRSLVLNNKTNQPSGSNEEDLKPDKKGGYVTKRDRHMQLINTSVYDKKTLERKNAIEETRRHNLLREDHRQQKQLEQHLHANVPRAANGNHEVAIDGIRFTVNSGGRKLVRIRGPHESSSITPKQAEVGGIQFFRSTNHNLIRSDLYKAKKNSGKIRKISEPCARFTSTGLCPKGPRCRYIHDPKKVAMCKDHLRTGTCPPKDEPCHLSHDPTPERVPACLHFLRGNCTKPSCRYAHVRVNPSAPVCKAFGTVGYCSKGAECSERHVHECPDYTNTGVCHNKKCRLPHVDRADQMRKHAANNTGPTTSSAEDEDSDIVSDEDDDLGTDDVDSDGLEEMMGSSDASHALSQQRDFVHF